jgi:hypothetical protein
MSARSSANQRDAGGHRPPLQRIRRFQWVFQQPARLKRVRFLGEVEMKERISMWEGEGGSVNETSEKALTGTVNQIEWAKQIKTQVNAEFDRVKTALEAAAVRQSGQDRMDTQAVIAILQDKRAEVMAHQEAGYFIHDWQELRDQVRQMIMKDGRYKAIKAGKVQLI